MRAVKYMKVDYMLTKRQMLIMPLMVLVSVLLVKSAQDFGVMMGCSYMIFVATIFATAPFGSCHIKNTGFLLMLPATVADRVAGRFLYGLSFMAATALLCAAGMGISCLLGFEITTMMAGLFLGNLALGVVIVALEYLLSYVLGEGKNNWQYVGNIVRVAPGMVMYFMFMFIFTKADGEAYVADRLAFLAKRSIYAGVVVLAASLLIMAVSAAICVKAIERRDYA